MKKAKKRGYVLAMNLQVLLCCLLLLSAAVHVSKAQSCPVVGCTGCGTTTVNCANAGLTSFPQLPLDVQRTVETLNLDSNMIGQLDAGVLENYTDLTALYLSNNQLTELPEGLFATTTRLQYLRLFTNRLTKLPEGLFATTTQLLQLWLQNNKLTEIPVGLLDATTELQYLWLHTNQLTEIPVGLLNATTELHYLYLYGNQLTELPEGLLDTTTQLQRLYLQGNPLTELPEGLLATTTQLLKLYLHGCQLTGLREGLFATTKQLEHLLLYPNPLHCDCKLRWLPDFLRNQLYPFQSPNCATPADLSGNAVVSLTEDQLVCGCVPECVHGNCNMTLGTCECNDNYTGVDCNTCVPGTWGTDCLQNCLCVMEHESSPCDTINGTCNCLPGYTDDDCSSPQVPQPGKISVTDSFHCGVIVWETPDYPEGEITGYTVRIYYEVNGERTNFSTVIYSISNKKTQWLAPAVLPMERPLFYQVRALSLAGPGDWSSQSVLADSPDCPLAECPTVAPTLMPITKPGRIHIVQVVNSMVMWNPPESTGGEISLYVLRVYYRSTQLQFEIPQLQFKINVHFYNTEREWVVLQQLPPEKQFFIQVRAQNSAGAGPWSREVQVP